MDAYKFSSKSPQIYEPILKTKDNKIAAPLNYGNPNQNQTKNAVNKPNLNSINPQSQEEIEASELAQAQKSLRLLKAKMSATPKQIFNPNFEETAPNEKNYNNKNFGEKNKLNNQANEDAGNQNYRKIFKPNMYKFFLSNLLKSFCSFIIIIIIF